MKNRLRLDFSLQTTEERTDFINNYLPTLDFELTDHELETASDYILWGKNQEGLNAQQEGGIIIKEWAPSTNVESIEGLMETPGFNETQFKSLGDTHYKARRLKFDREEALEKAPPYQRQILRDLFKQIDRTELTINYYDIKVGKRKTAPRSALLNVFTDEEKEAIQKSADKLNQRKYLKLRHYLVELRNEQYTIRDSFVSQIMPHIQPISEGSTPNFSFGENVLVRPLGLNDGSELAQKMFQDVIYPNDFTEKDLEGVSKILWRESKPEEIIFDFENPEHVLNLCRNYHDLDSDAIEDPNQVYGAARALINTLKYYWQQAKFNDIQNDILQFKIDGRSNIEISSYVNGKYGTTYNPNYISTIYRHKIIATINKAAYYHKLVMSNIFWPENFKVCKDCGDLRLRSPEFFMRQGKSSDGFVPRCKRCQTIKRATLKAQREERARIGKYQ